MAKQKALPADVEVLPALPEQALTESDGKTILGFLTSIVPFFKEARRLEEAAKDRLARARTLTLPHPGDVDGDGRLQVFIREASAEIKEVEKHWTITSVVFQFQRKLVAARDRVIGEGGKNASAGYLVEAKNTAQQLHNTFTEDARRRAAEEQERLRKEEEARQAELRRQELERLENEALVAEAASKELSARELKFVENVARGVSPADAATLAQFKDPKHYGEKLLALPKIKAAIKGIADAAEVRRQAEAVKETPLDVQVPTVQAKKSSIGVDRSTYSAELLDERLLVEAVLGGKHGIPADVLTVNTTRLNAYARDMRDVINRWPGVRLKKTTTTV